MRELHPGLAGQLAGGASTLCRCWRLIRKDGLVLGFTDHDRDIALDGTICRAATGLEAAEITAELGLAVGGGDVSGALVDAGLTEQDLVAGRYDDAAIEVWLVNWQNPAERHLLDAGTIGEVRRTDTAFFAEVRSLAHRLDEEKGRIYGATCSADLGDGRCRVALAAGGLTASGLVAGSDGRLGFTTTDLSAYAAGFFTDGRLVWEGGAKDGVAHVVKIHARAAGITTISLWEPSALPIAPGDGFRISAGCDKTFATCRDKFSNHLNFRGFPHIPGSDAVIRYARTGQGAFDGGSLFR